MSKFAPRACGPVAGPVCQATEIGQAIVPHDASALPFRSEMSLYLGFCRPRAAHRGPTAGPAVLTVKSGPVAGPPVHFGESGPAAGPAVRASESGPVAGPSARASESGPVAGPLCKSGQIGPTAGPACGATPAVPVKKQNRSVFRSAARHEAVVRWSDRCAPPAKLVRPPDRSARYRFTTMQHHGPAAACRGPRARGTGSPSAQRGAARALCRPNVGVAAAGRRPSVGAAPARGRPGDLARHASSLSRYFRDLREDSGVQSRNSTRSR